MNVWVFLIAAILLSFERICYVWAWRSPGSFRAFCDRPAVASLGEPVAVLQKLFYCFKGIQFAVFLGWCYFHGQESPSLLTEGGLSSMVGGALIVVGQILNFGVFHRLGKVGVFYGNRFGYELPWRREFPFSLFKHPQYVGVLLSIWGFFLALRFPHDDWFLLPTLETVYYALGAYCEQ
ncbi:MAG: methyltransferase [Candidatus Binatia bacterium]